MNSGRLAVVRVRISALKQQASFVLREFASEWYILDIGSTFYSIRPPTPRESRQFQPHALCVAQLIEFPARSRYIGCRKPSLADGSYP